MAGEERPEELGQLADEVRWLREFLESLRLQRYVQALLNTRRMIWMSLLRGIFGAIGAIIGATIGLALLLWILSGLEVVPFIGEFVSKIVKIVESKS